MEHYTLKHIQNLVTQMQQQKILILGDLMLDQFIWGKVNRISPEAPVPIVQVTHESAYPGGAANVARNLADFGIKASMCGILGKDVNGDKLLQLLNSSNIDTDVIVVPDGYETIVKTRIIAKHQQVVRVDRENIKGIPESMFPKLIQSIEKIIDQMDAIIIEDYGKGFITQELVDSIVSIAIAKNKIITIDPNPNNPLDWPGVTLIKPNRSEAYAAAGVPLDESSESLHAVGKKLFEKWTADYILITLGEDGLMLFHPPEAPFHTPTKAREVYDVSGAGDTVIAFFTAALAAGLTGQEAAQLANHAAGIVVGKLGTATLTPDELYQSFENNE